MKKKRTSATVEIINDGDFERLARRTKKALAELQIPWQEP